MSISNESADARRLHIDTVTHPASLLILLRGEADIATAADLDTALKAVRLVKDQSVHLHVEDLGFVDVTTMRLLTEFARRAREAGHLVMACRAKPLFRKVATLVEAHHELALLPDPETRVRDTADASGTDQPD